jgi:hypothetical protein
MKTEKISHPLLTDPIDQIADAAGQDCGHTDPERRDTPSDQQDGRTTLAIPETTIKSASPQS